MIIIDHLSYTYPNQQRPALREVSWRVAAGTFVLLTGPSGSGKSTLLRCLNGLVPHFSGGTISGQVLVNGLEAIAVGPQQLSRQVGFVLQNPEAQAVLDTVGPEIAFALENAAVPPAEMRWRVAEVLDLLELTPLKQRPLISLSGGEKQRVAIAAALALRPQLLVLDEPTSQLDPQSAAEVLHTLVQLNQRLGLTIVLAEHRLERVLPYAHWLTYMEDGQIVADGPVREVIGRLPAMPPVTALGRQLGWQPLPLTVAEAQPYSANLPIAGFAAPLVNLSTQPAAVPLLQATGVGYGYGDKLALQEVDLTVGAGEVVALLGRNGAGKSTLLKCLVGLLAVQTGEVVVNGRSIRGRAVADICREVAYLPQNPDDLLFADSVAEELAVTCRNHGLAVAEQAQDRLLAQLGLTAVAAAYPRDLSVGQRQRVALGAVTITQPGLLLLDEPTRGLDFAAKAALVAVWQQWVAEGMGILLVTHDVELVAQVAQRVIILEMGRVVAAGKLAEVYSAAEATAVSPFAPQMVQLFPGRGWLTVADVVGKTSEVFKTSLRFKG